MTAEPRTCLALRFSNFASSHLDRDFGAALLAAGAAVERCEVEPFVGFDQVDVHSAAAGRLGHAEFEQGVDISAIGIRNPAAKKELCTLLADGTHVSSPPIL